MIEIVKEALLGSVKSVYSMALVVIPMMILLQIAKDYKVLSKVADFFEFTTRLLGISKESITPLLVGVFFGISYGAGVIIESSREGNLTKRDAILLMVFFVACHGIIEDTLIFVAVGAKGFPIVVLRVLAAVFLTSFLARSLNKNLGSPAESKSIK